MQKLNLNAITNFNKEFSNIEKYKTCCHVSTWSRVDDFELNRLRECLKRHDLKTNYFEVIMSCGSNNKYTKYIVDMGENELCSLFIEGETYIPHFRYGTDGWLN